MDERSGSERSSPCRDRGATKLARICWAVKALDDIAKDHVTHSDRRADDSGQKKVQTADER